MKFELQKLVTSCLETEKLNNIDLTELNTLILEIKTSLLRAAKYGHERLRYNILYRPNSKITELIVEEFKDLNPDVRENSFDASTAIFFDWR